MGYPTSNSPSAPTATPLRDLPTVHDVRLPDQYLGLYDAKTHTIWLNDRLTAAERRCTLMHELVHAERGDVGEPDEFLCNKRERHVHREAARRLIHIDALIAALRFSSAWQSVCEELEVDWFTFRARLTSLTRWEREQLALAGIPVQWPLRPGKIERKKRATAKRGQL